MTARRRIALSTAEIAAASQPVPSAPVVDSSTDPTIPKGMCRVNLRLQVNLSGNLYGPGEGVLVPADAAGVWWNALA